MTLPILDPGVTLDPEAIVRAMVARTGIGRETLLSRDGNYHEVIWARHELIWLLQEYGRLSRAAIGRLMGGRDGTSIRNSLRKVAQRASEVPEYLAEIAQLATFVIGSTSAARSAPLPDVAVLMLRGVLTSPTLSDADARTAAREIMERYYA